MRQVEIRNCAREGWGKEEERREEKRERDGSHKTFTVGEQASKAVRRGIRGLFRKGFRERTRLVFRSTRDGGDKKHKNLYIMEDANVGEFGGKITRLTKGAWTDTHCEWSPNGEWIVFSSTRDKPQDAPESDNGLDPGYFAVYLVWVKDPKVVVRVIQSGYNVVGHVNHPMFSLDGRSFVVTAGLAAVSADPISLPLILHSVRPYGDIFTVDIDPVNINKSKDVHKFQRMTHSRYENSTPSWTRFIPNDPNVQWNNVLITLEDNFQPACPFMYPNEGEGWHMTGHLCIGTRSR